MPKVIPFGDRILVRRRKVGSTTNKDSLIELPDSVKEGLTDLADVVYVPELTFTDQELITHANQIVNSMVGKAKEGSSEALISLLRFNDFLKIKTLKPGDAVMIGKYVGTEFHDNVNPQDTLTLIKDEDVIGLLAEN